MSKRWLVVCFLLSCTVNADDGGFAWNDESSITDRVHLPSSQQLTDHFYLCYPRTWSDQDADWFESHYRLNRSGRTAGKKVRIYQAAGVLDSVSQSSYFKKHGILDCSELLMKMRMASKALNDTYFSDQWFLENTGQSGNPGEDISVMEAWNNATGKGVVIAIMDDGLEITHPDLVSNMVPGLSWDFVANDSDPTASDHGTAVAGIAAATGNNGIGVGGVAYDAGLVGLRVLDETDFVLETDVAAAIQHQLQAIDIMNVSWGPPDGDTGAFDKPTASILTAFQTATNEGRNGLGRIFLWAAGNGGGNDNSNLDGYANSRYTIAVTASTDQGVAASYSEKGANILITAPSGGGVNDITTTDRSGTLGYNQGHSELDYFDKNYTNGFGGTSAATPVVSGVVALMLEANPELGWRDVQAILAASADKIDALDEDWKTNGAGYPISEQYGYGRVNAEKAVELAVGWGPNMQSEVATKRYFKFVNQPIPDNDPTGVTASFNVEENIRAQHVEVTVDVPDHTYWGDLEMELTSPSGITTQLVGGRVLESSSAKSVGYNGWKLTDVLRNGERSKGTWALKVTDAASRDVGTLSSWGLKVYGTALPNLTTDLGFQCKGVGLFGPALNEPPLISFGASKHGSKSGLRQVASQQDDVNISYSFSGLRKGDSVISLAQYINLANGSSIWLMYDGAKWIPWGGHIDNLVSYSTSNMLSGRVSALYHGRLPPGQLYLFFGARLDAEETIYCPTPLSLLID